MTTDPPDVSISRVFAAPRALVYRAFTDPAQLAAWWGPTGSVRPLDEMAFHDEADGRTRLEVRQWLPADVAGATEEGWRQSFAQLDAHLATTAGAPR